MQLDSAEVINLWHIARTALDNPSRFDRLQYVKREYLKSHPEWLAKPTTLWIELCDATTVRAELEQHIENALRTKSQDNKQ